MTDMFLSRSTLDGVAISLDGAASRWRRRFGSRRGQSHTSAASSREVLTVGSASTSDIVPVWVFSVQVRLLELARKPQGWDSYGARPLQVSSVSDFIEVLATFSHAIQSEPLVSLTSEGGLIATWENSAGCLDLITDPGQIPRIMYEDAVNGAEWDGPLRASPLVEKWLWHTSAAH